MFIHSPFIGHILGFPVRECVNRSAIFIRILLNPFPIRSDVYITVASDVPGCLEISENKTGFRRIHVQEPTFVKYLRRHSSPCLDRYPASAERTDSFFVVSQPDIFPVYHANFFTMGTFTNRFSPLFLFVNQVPAKTHAFFPYPVKEFFRSVFDRVHNCVDLISFLFVLCCKTFFLNFALKPMYGTPRFILVFWIHVFAKEVLHNFQFFIRPDKYIFLIRAFVLFAIPYVI